MQNTNAAQVTGIISTFVKEDWQAGWAWNVGIRWTGEKAEEVYLGGFDSPKIPYEVATEAEKAAYYAWKKNQEEVAAQFRAARYEEEALRFANKGETLKVIKKRGKDNGREGKLIKTGNGQYGPYAVLLDEEGTFCSNLQYLHILCPMFDVWVPANF